MVIFRMPPPLRVRYTPQMAAELVGTVMKLRLPDDGRMYQCRVTEAVLTPGGAIEVTAEPQGGPVGPPPEPDESEALDLSLPPDANAPLWGGDV